MPQILFAGYKVPHPLQPYFLIKIQTDGTITPTALLEQACTKLIGTLATLEMKFKREFVHQDVGLGEGQYTSLVTTDSAVAGTKDYIDF